MRRRSRFILSLILTLAIAAIPASAFAASTWDTDVNSGSALSPRTVTVNHDIDATDGGVRARASLGGNATVTVNGNVSSTNESVQTSSNTAGKTTVTVNGDATSTNAEAVSASASGRNSATTVSVNNADGKNGVEASATNAGKTEVNVAGAVFAQDTGVEATANLANAETSVSVEVGVNAGETGIDASADNSGKTTVTVGDNIITDSESGAAVKADAMRNSTTDIDVNGVVMSEGDGLDLHAGDGFASFILNDESTVTAHIAESIYAAGNAIIASVDHRNAGIDVYVEDTVSGGKAPIAVDAESGHTEDNFKLTTWQIIPNDDGVIAVNMNGGDQNEEVEKNINYIIKTEQPLVGAVLKAMNAIGEALETSHGQDVALEGEKVLLKVDLEEGYRIVKAYNGLDEKTELLQDENGDYYVIVPKGGAVYLSAEVSNEYTVIFANDDDTVLQETEMEYGSTPSYDGETPEKESTAQYDYFFVGWAPEIDTVTGDITYKAVYEPITRSYDITFNLDGGKLNGQTGFIIENYEYGTVINLPKAPEKDGYRFLYWKGSEFAPGDEYTVEGAHTFTAVYEKIKDEKTVTPVADNKTPKAAAAITAPAKEAAADNIVATGDTSSMLTNMLLIIALVVMIVTGRKMIVSRKRS